MDARDWQKNEGRRMDRGALPVSSSRFQLLKRNTEYTETSMELGNNENRERNEREDPVSDGGSTSARREASAVPQVLRLAVFSLFPAVLWHLALGTSREGTDQRSMPEIGRRMKAGEWMDVD